MVNNRFKWTFYIVVFSFASIMGIKWFREMEKEAKRNNKEYPLLGKNVNIHGKISNMFSTHGNPSIELDNLSKFTLKHSTNYSYNPYFLDNFLKVGDSLVKHSGSDTLYIYRNNENYYFVIGEIVGDGPKPLLNRR